MSSEPPFRRGAGGLSVPYRRALRQLGGALLASIVFWSVISVYAFHAAMPFNPIHLPFERIVQARVWIPEGWAFFTRSPREEQTFLFARHPNGDWETFPLGPYSEPSHLFGLSRRSRAQGMEMGMLVTSVPDSAWNPCQLPPGECLRNVPAALVQHNSSPSPTLCGPLGIIKQKPVPWAWSRSARKVTMPSRVLRLDVTC